VIALSLAPPKPADLHELLAFELKNRAFFEQHINARPVDFYCEVGVSNAIAAAERDANEDKAYQYIVRDDSNELIARVNLTRVRRAHFHSAELGYRVAQAHVGKGYAREAVRLALEKAFNDHRLVRIEATSRPENIGSVKVLTHNGFTQFGRSRKSVELGGVWYDLLHFEKRAGQ
jgi:[ribosomal protein S5]-alanine N-acetyltransferase